MEVENPPPGAKIYYDIVFFADEFHQERYPYAYQQKRFFIEKDAQDFLEECQSRGYAEITDYDGASMDSFYDGKINLANVASITQKVPGHFEIGKHYTYYEK